MRLIKPAAWVVFADKNKEDKFNALPNNDLLQIGIQKAILDMKENVFCGEHIPKNLIPKQYIKNYKITNLWWYPLPHAWRLVYSIITPSNIEIGTSIIDYMNHKDYERIFHY